jgi:glycosyltransferase involved in cell wall biosynthesis
MKTNPLTVVQMLPDLHSGGVERGTLELGDYLVRQGHRSIVISEGGPMVAALEKQGSRHIRLPVGGKNPVTLTAVLPLRHLLLREKVDILHLRSRVPAWVGYLAYKSLSPSLRPKLVTTFHGFYSTNAYSAIMTRGEKIIAVSNTVATHIKTCYGVHDDRIHVIHRGFDERLFTPGSVDSARINVLKDRWSLTGTPSPLITLPGRITQWKGHDIFIRSLAAIKDLPWTAVCVGDFDGKQALMQELTALIRSCGLEGRIRFVGHCADMPAAYLLSDIVVSASSTEPEAFGRVAIEAQAMGKPVVATAHGGSMETVLDGKTGWLVAPGDVKGMAWALSEAVSKPDLRQRYGKAAMAWTRRQFTVEKMCRETLTLYHSLLQRGNLNEKGIIHG